MEPNPYQSPNIESIAERPSRRPTFFSWFKVTGVLVASGMVLLVLWCFPLAGFHHQYLVGLFGWLLINGEDPDPRSWLYFAGEEYLPNPCGLVPTLIATWFILRFNWRMFHRRPE